MKPKIELTSVIQALAVAEHRSFRRAAEALGVCQSSVSKRVIKLENVLGVDLFDRHHTGVKVTNAGAHFFDQVRTAIENLDCAVKAAGMAGRVERGNLKVGIISSLASGFLPELLRRYSALHPDIAVSFVEGAPRENLTLLRAEQLDIAFVMGEPVARDCDVVRFWSERMFVVLPETHRFCAKNAVAWEDLRGEIFILSQSEPGLAFHDYVIRQLAALDHRPDVRQSPVARDTLMHMVALGQGISLTSEATIAMPFPDVVFRPIAGNSDVLPFSGVWLLRNSNQALRRFISLARTLSKNRNETNEPVARASGKRKCPR
ncbi:MAG: LysR family transcriptional regulator [Methylocella sp.]